MYNVNKDKRVAKGIIKKQVASNLYWKGRVQWIM